MTATVDKMIAGLEECRDKMTAKEGLIFATNLCETLGGYVEINNEPEQEYTVLNVGGESISVWQVYPDIDKIYYEY